MEKKHGLSASTPIQILELYAINSQKPNLVRRFVGPIWLRVQNESEAKSEQREKPRRMSVRSHARIQQLRAAFVQWN
jgi:hypothetical protein